MVINQCSSNVADFDQQNSNNKMEINWDIIINVIVIGSIILFAISKLTSQTIGEMFKGIREFILDTRQEVSEGSEDLMYYD